MHFLSLPLFVTSAIHGLSAGTDGRRPMVLISALLASCAVVGLGVVRLQQSRPDRDGAPAAAPGRSRQLTNH